MHAIKNSLSTILGAAFVAATVLLGLLILSAQLPGGQMAINQLRCLAGIPETGSACVQDVLRDARTAQSQAEDAQKQLLNALQGQNLVFVQGPKISDGASLVVGTIYRDVANQSGALRSFCWAIFDHGGLDPRVGLATREADGRITSLPIAPKDEALLKLGAAELAKVGRGCPWPVD